MANFLDVCMRACVPVRYVFSLQLAYLIFSLRLHLKYIISYNNTYTLYILNARTQTLNN